MNQKIPEIQTVPLQQTRPKRSKKALISDNLMSNLETLLILQPEYINKRAKSSRKAKNKVSKVDVRVQYRMTKQVKKNEEELQEKHNDDSKVTKKILEFAQSIPVYGRFFDYGLADACSSQVDLKIYFNSVHQQLLMEMQKQSDEIQCWKEKLNLQIKDEL